MCICLAAILAQSFSTQVWSLGSGVSLSVNSGLACCDTLMVRLRNRMPASRGYWGRSRPARRKGAPRRARWSAIARSSRSSQITELDNDLGGRRAGPLREYPAGVGDAPPAEDGGATRSQAQPLDRGWAHLPCGQRHSTATGQDTPEAESAVAAGREVSNSRAGVSRDSRHSDVHQVALVTSMYPKWSPQYVHVPVQGGWNLNVPMERIRAMCAFRLGGRVSSEVSAVENGGLPWHEVPSLQGLGPHREWVSVADAADGKVWAANGLVAIQVHGCTIRFRGEIRAWASMPGPTATTFASPRHGRLSGHCVKCYAIPFFFCALGPLGGGLGAGTGVRSVELAIVSRSLAGHQHHRDPDAPHPSPPILSARRAKAS